MIVSALKQSSTTAVFCKGAPFRPGACAWAAAMCRVAGNALAATCLAVAFPHNSKGSVQLLSSPAPGENGCHGADFAEGWHSGPWEGRGHREAA